MWNLLRDLLNDFQAIRDLLKKRTENFREKRAGYHLADLDLRTPDSKATN